MGACNLGRGRSKAADGLAFFLLIIVFRSSTTSSMPHRYSSCRRGLPAFVQAELMLLYARRTKITAEILALECDGEDVKRNAGSRGLEISANPCNLTTCRNAYPFEGQ